MARRLGDRVEYALEGSVFAAGSVIQRLRDGMRMLGKAFGSQAYAERIATAEGVYMVPAFVVLDAPYWRSDVRGAIFGLRRGTIKERFMRAALESMAHQSRDVLSTMAAEVGISLKELRVDGGATTNDFMTQCQRHAGCYRVASAGAGSNGSRCGIPCQSGRGLLEQLRGNRLAMAGRPAF